MIENLSLTLFLKYCLASYNYWSLTILAVGKLSIECFWLLLTWCVI